MEIALREADETLYWLEILLNAKVLPEKKLSKLIEDTDRLVAILVATVNSTKRKN